MKNQSTTSSSSRYFLSVDGLRLIASLNIVLFHFENMGGLNDLGGSPAWLFRILKGPAFHASIFFILGGFIFATKFLPKAAEFKTLPFLRKRFSELYPLHFITTIAMMILMLVKLPAESIDFGKFAFSGFMHLSLLWSLFPFFSYNLNTPSWALSAFFLCYLLFKPLLIITGKLKTKRVTILSIFLCFIPVFLWTLLYRVIEADPKWYMFFHIFAPVRLFEFVAGMFLARLLQLSEQKKYPFYTGILVDILLIASAFAIYNLLSLKSPDNKFLAFMTYHLFLTPIFCLILFLLTSELGFISRILSISFIRNTGRSSFYPYLIHIPLVSSVAFILERYFNYYRLLHSPVNITIIIFVLYGGSYVYVNYIRKRSRPPGKKEGREIREARRHQIVGISE